MIAFPSEGAIDARGGRLPRTTRIDGLDDEFPPVADPAAEDGAAPPLLDRKAVAADLGPGGAVADGFIPRAEAGGYEDRASQRDMAACIADLYNEGGVGLLEAGTGVGKSLAYLVPALRWAALRGERTVVSTNTINLQEQLVGKDLPLLASALHDQPVRFALLKGWRNYLCLHRLDHARLAAGALFDTDQQQGISALVSWAAETEDGTLTDAPTPVPRAEVWDEVAAEPDLCLRQQCPFFDRCFVFRARRAAAQADIVVVNHHLLMSDVAVRRVQHNWTETAVIPAYDRLVIDEGHHLEEAAAAHLGTSVTRRGWQRLMARLERRAGRGLLAQLVQVLAGMDDLLAAATVDLVREKLIPATIETRDRGDLVFDLLATVLAEQGESQLRLAPDFAQHPVWAAGLTVAVTDLGRGILAVDDALRLIQGRHGGDQLRHEGLARILGELRGVSRRLAAAAEGIEAGLVPAPDGEAAVRWLELRRAPRDRDGDGMRLAGAALRGANVAVCAVPLDLAPILREDLFDRLQTTVITSATLAAEGRFEFLASRLGVDLSDERTRARRFPSPFDYFQQALVTVPTDIPAPNIDPEGHAAAVTRIVRDVVDVAGGGVFALYTSHRDLRSAAAALRSSEWGASDELLVHGEEPRDVLLRRFRASGNAVLLGTASFWEGVDVPGRALRALIIARLPFRVPTEPITAAQCERIAADGGDPFVEYMLPQASLRLNQGFGRLIRSTTDRGAVIIADPRLVSRPYGRELLEGLPPARRLRGPWSALRAEIARFYARG